MTEKKFDDGDIVVHSAAELDAEKACTGTHDHDHDQVYGDDIQKGLKRGLKPRHVSVSPTSVRGVSMRGLERRGTRQRGGEERIRVRGAREGRWWSEMNVSAARNCPTDDDRVSGEQRAKWPLFVRPHRNRISTITVWGTWAHEHPGRDCPSAFLAHLILRIGLAAYRAPAPRLLPFSSYFPLSHPLPVLLHATAHHPAPSTQHPPSNLSCDRAQPHPTMLRHSS